MTKVTAVIPIRNGERYIPRFLQQLNSTMEFVTELETIFVDDGSNDNTFSLLRGFSQNLPNVRLIKTKPMGLVNALNLGIKESTGKLIARYDIDDIYKPERIHKQIQYFEQFNPVALFSDSEVVTETGRVLTKTLSPIYDLPTKFSIFRNRRTPHSSCLLNKEALFEVGQYQEDEFPAEDKGLWLRLSQVGEVLSIPETLMSYQLSRDSVSTLRRRQQVSQGNRLTLKHMDSLKFLYRELVHNLEDVGSLYQGSSEPHLRTSLLFEELLEFWFLFERDNSRIFPGLKHLPTTLHSILDVPRFASNVLKRRIYRKLL